MPYLNWKAQPLRAERVKHETRETELRFVFDEPAAIQLADALEALFAQGIAASGVAASELRVDLPDGWALFFKAREFESRLLVAHPQPGEYVATAALELGHGQALVTHLRALRAGSRVAVGELAEIGSFSNVELVFSRAE